MSYLAKLKSIFSRTEREIIHDAKVLERKAEVQIEKAKEELEYQETRMARIGYRLLSFLLMPIIRWLWVHKVEGLENIPKEGGCIIAANHQSYFDFLCFTSISPRKIHYLAAEKFFEHKLWRPLMQLTGQIKVNRKAKDKADVHGLVISALKQKRVIGIFPEGTRSSDGELNKAFTGVAKFALKAKVPIIPVGIIGTFEIMSRHDKVPKLKKARIVIGEPRHFHEHHGKHEDEKITREVTDQIMLEIARLCGKEYRHLENLIESPKENNNNDDK